jgi:hypothetical protein
VVRLYPEQGYYVSDDILEKEGRPSVFCSHFYFRFQELKIQILNLFVEMTCTFIHTHFERD